MRKRFSPACEQPPGLLSRSRRSVSLRLDGVPTQRKMHPQFGPTGIDVQIDGFSLMPRKKNPSYPQRFLAGDRFFRRSWRPPSFPSGDLPSTSTGREEAAVPVSTRDKAENIVGAGIGACGNPVVEDIGSEPMPER
jgi:hypothetical protein